jgi:hypothetical protein
LITRVGRRLVPALAARAARVALPRAWIGGGLIALRLVSALAARSLVTLLGVGRGLVPLRLVAALAARRPAGLPPRRTVSPRPECLAGARIPACGGGTSTTAASGLEIRRGCPKPAALPPQHGRAPHSKPQAAEVDGEIGGSSNGRTADSDSVNLGSNPSPPAN